MPNSITREPTAQNAPEQFIECKSLEELSAALYEASSQNRIIKIELKFKNPHSIDKGTIEDAMDICELRYLSMIPTTNGTVVIEVERINEKNWDRYSQTFFGQFFNENSGHTLSIARETPMKQEAEIRLDRFKVGTRIVLLNTNNQAHELKVVTIARYHPLKNRLQVLSWPSDPSLEGTFIRLDRSLRTATYPSVDHVDDYEGTPIYIPHTGGKPKIDRLYASHLATQTELLKKQQELILAINTLNSSATEPINFAAEEDELRRDMKSIQQRLNSSIHLLRSAQGEGRNQKQETIGTEALVERANTLIHALKKQGRWEGSKEEFLESIRVLNAAFQAYHEDPGGIKGVDTASLSLTDGSQIEISFNSGLNGQIYEITKVTVTDKK